MKNRVEEKEAYINSYKQVCIKVGNWGGLEMRYCLYCGAKTELEEEKPKVKKRYNTKEIQDLVAVELLNATQTFKAFNSCHEGLAVIWEEFEELKIEVFKKQPDNEKLLKEAVQVAAMAERFILDLIETDSE